MMVNILLASGLFVSGNEGGIAPFQILVINALASGHQAVGKGQGGQMHVASGVLEPDETFVSGFLILFDDGFSHSLEFTESRCHITFRLKTFVKRDGVFERE